MDSRFAQHLMRATQGRLRIRSDIRQRIRKAEKFLEQHPGHKGSRKFVRRAHSFLSGDSITKSVTKTESVTLDEAREIARALKISLKKYDIDQLRRGIEVELEHKDLLKNDNNKETAAKIACQHLDEYPDYYSRLERVED